MALTINHPTLKEQTVHGHSPSIGASPIGAVMRAPFRGKVIKLFAVTGGAITTADATVTASVNGTTNTTGAFTITVTGAAAGQLFSSEPIGMDVQEDDVIRLLPAGASGASIPATFGAVIRAG